MIKIKGQMKIEMWWRFQTVFALYNEFISYDLIVNSFSILLSIYIIFL